MDRTALAERIQAWWVSVAWSRLVRVEDWLVPNGVSTVFAPAEELAVGIEVTQAFRFGTA